MQFSFGPGVFPDCSLADDGRGALIMREGDPRAPGYVRVYSWLRVDATEFVGLHEVAKFPVGAGSPSFPRVYFHDGLLWCAYHDGVSGHLHCLTNGHHERLEPCENNEPIVFGCGMVAWQGAAADGWPVKAVVLESGLVSPLPEFGQGTGLAYIDCAANNVVTVDENRMSVPGLVNPVRAGSLTVGEDPDPANRDNLGAKWKFGDSIFRTLWANQPCLTPRCATAGALYAVTTWGQGADVRLFVGTLSDLITASNTPIEPEPDMEYPAAEWSIVQQMHARFAGNFPETEDGARGFTEMVIQQLVHSFPSGGWCWKKSGPTSPPSKDCTARQTGGRFEGWDILMSAGVTGPKVLATDPAYHDLAGQVPIAVTPVNHLGGVVEPPADGKHAYTRDDDERDECNFVMPDGSQCDKPKADPIHQGVIDPPDKPEEPPPAGGVTNAQIMAQLKALSAHLGLR